MKNISEAGDFKVYAGSNSRDFIEAKFTLIK
jgi:hypothetical protein